MEHNEFIIKYMFNSLAATHLKNFIFQTSKQNLKYSLNCQHVCKTKFKKALK